MEYFDCNAAVGVLGGGPPGVGLPAPALVRRQRQRCARQQLDRQRAAADLGARVDEVDGVAVAERTAEQ